jgi:hypothetical protein
MAETEKQETVVDLENDASFAALPLLQKNARFQKVANNDVEFQKMSEKGQSYWHQKLFTLAVRGKMPPASPDFPGALGAKPETPTSQGPEEGPQAPTTALAPSPLAAAGGAALDLLAKIAPDQAKSLRERFGLTDVPTQTTATHDEGATNPADLASAASTQSMVGKSVIRAIDAPVGMVVGGIGGGIEHGLGTPDSDNALTQVGKAMQSPAATRPVETAMTGGKGLPPAPEGYETMQHLLDAAVGGATSGAILHNFFPLVQAGIPMTPSVLKMTYLSLQGAGAAEAVKKAGGNPWTQAVAELIAGGISIGDIKKSLKAMLDHQGLLKHIGKAAQAEKNLQGNMQEGHAIESAAPGTKFTAGELADSPSLQATQRQVATFSPETETAMRGRTESNIQALTGGMEQAVGQSPEGTAALEQQHAAAAGDVTTTRSALTAAQEAEATTKSEAAATKEMAERHQQQQLEKTHAEGLAARDKMRAQEQLSKKTVAEAQKEHDDFNEAQDRKNAVAEKTLAAHVQETAPELAVAADPTKVPEKALAQAEAAERKIHEHYVESEKAFETEAEKVYKPFADAGVAEPYAAGEDSLKARIQGLENKLAERTQGRFTPGSLIADIDKAVVAENPTVGDVSNTKVSIDKVRRMRSEALKEQRRTQDPTRKMALGMLAQELDTHMEGMANRAEQPELIDKIHAANRWYAQNSRIYNFGPGADALALRPEAFVAPGTMPQPRDFQYNNGQLLDTLIGPGPTPEHLSRGAEKLQAFETLLKDAADKPDVLDAVRTTFRQRFFLETFDHATGKADPKKVIQWVKDHRKFLQADPKLAEAFATPESRAHELQTAYSESQALKVDAAEKLAATTAAEKAATDTAKEASTQTRQGLAEVTRDARQRAKELKEVAASQAEGATEARKKAEDAATKAVEDYEAKYGPGNAGKVALDDHNFQQAVGTSAKDIVRRIEAISNPDVRNAEYARLFQDHGNDPGVKRAILRGMWDHFVEKEQAGSQTTPSTTLADRVPLLDPERVNAWMNKNHAFLQANMPEYLKDLKLVNEGFRRIARGIKPQGTTPEALEPTSPFAARRQAVGTGILLKIFGMGSLGAGIGGEAMYMSRRINNASKAHIVTNALLNPEETGVLAMMLDKKVSPRYRDVALYSALARQGLIKQTADQDEHPR